MLDGESLNPHVLDRGDFNDDGRLDTADIDLLSAAVDGLSLDPRFDANRDGTVDNSDRLFWVRQIRKTYFGDTNLDGMFASSDLVLSFQAGLYEDNIPKNATWSSGDVNGDAEFSSSDLVLAFQTGGYELGPRPVKSPNLVLAEGFDSTPIGDGTTDFSLVSLVGETDPFVSVELLNDGRTIHLGADGKFNFSGVELKLGKNQLAFRVSDIVGNEATESITVFRSPTDQSLTIDETSSFATEFVVPVEFAQTEGKQTLSFQVDAGFDTSDQSSLISDTFLVYLVDSNDLSNTLLDRGQPGTAVFQLSEEGAEFPAGLVRYDGRVVQIDVTSLQRVSDGRLLFQFLNHDQDSNGAVAINNVSINVASNGTEVPVFPQRSVFVAAGGQVQLDEYTESTSISSEISNSRYDSVANRYTAELRVRNLGSSVGRQILVSFGQLPNGVRMVNPSVVDNQGRRYVNMRNAIRSGGLAAASYSDAVEVAFENPNNVPLVFRPRVLVGPANRAPSFSQVSPINVMPGESRAVSLGATDADGDPITYSIKSDVALPAMSLTSGGILKIVPTPAQLGSYKFQVVASDGSLSTSREISLNVIDDPVGTTRLTGQILDTNERPLGGVTVALGPLSTATGADGSFVFDVGSASPLPGNKLEVHGTELPGPEAFPFIAEPLHLLLDHEVFPGKKNVITRPVYLPALDMANAVTIDPEQDTTVTTSAIPGTSVLVSAGSLEDKAGGMYTGQLSITEVPAERTPAALPGSLVPDLVLTIQPGDMVFNQPAPLNVPNRGNYPPGTEMDLWSINPATGNFDIVGVGLVNADGTLVETVSGGIRTSSWHFFSPPALQQITDDLLNEFGLCGRCPYLGAFNSEVEMHSGALIEGHSLVTYQSFGQQRGFDLRYDSQNADANHIVHFGFENVQSNPNSRIVGRLSVQAGSQKIEVLGS
ncbi:MAG: hypothetical protein KDB23_03115, partial [Planctomycetales bacterium]|nr:hypothetical protein [Planctomycetales bacterium]